MTVTPDPAAFDPMVYRRLTRIACLDADFSAGSTYALAEGQAHHLRVVLRAGDGEQVRVFHPVHGEWLAVLRHAGKRGVAVEMQSPLRAAIALPDIWLVASPLKKDALDIMIEKASELGAARFVPVIAEHTAVHRLNVERAHAQAIDAAEQCERFDVMTVDDVAPLSRVLDSWPRDRVLYVALERSAAPPFLTALREVPPPAQMAVLIGPEGGFSAHERDHLLSLPFVQPVSLGSTILRAETAAVTALGLLAGFIQAK